MTATQLVQRARRAEALRFIEAEASRMIHSLRQAKETPREGVEAGLLLIQQAAEQALQE